MLHFHSFINSPFTPTVFARMDEWKERERGCVRGKRGQVDWNEFKGEWGQTVNTVIFVVPLALTVRTYSVSKVEIRHEDVVYFVSDFQRPWTLCVFLKAIHFHHLAHPWETAAQLKCPSLCNFIMKGQRRSTKIWVPYTCIPSGTLTPLIYPLSHKYK